MLNGEPAGKPVQEPGMFCRFHPVSGLDERETSSWYCLDQDLKKCIVEWVACFHFQ